MLIPCQIYKSLIKQEESQSGEKSTRAHETTPALAAADPEVKSVQTQSKSTWSVLRVKQVKSIKKLHNNTKDLAKLTEITNDFLEAIMGSIKKMPYGIRYIAMKMKEHMLKKFPESEEEISKIVGNLIYYRYINPAIVAPEAFDVIESNISPTQRKNLAEVTVLYIFHLF